MSTLFLPLRSNCGWFTSEDTHALLAQRLKSWLLFYDVIAPENGRYTAAFNERASFDWAVGPEAIDDRTVIEYYEPGSEFEVRVGSEPDGVFHPLMSGPTFIRYVVDFFPLLSEAGITQADYIYWINSELAGEGKQAAQKSAAEALRNAGNNTFIETTNRWLNKKVVENLHYDAFLAAALNLPMSVDARASTIVERSNQLANEHWSHEATSIIQQSWLSLGLPDPGRESWDTVLSARESAAGKDLRRVIGHLSEFAAEILAGEGSEEDFASEVRKLLVGELVSELLKRRSTTREASINLGLNLIPFGSALGTANDVRKVVREHHSWVALLGRLDHGEFRPI
jgi:hypothetical protein